VLVRTRVGEYLVREDLYYTDSDEWVRISGDEAVVGITDYAQKKLKYIVSVELSSAGREVRRGEVIATLESVKAIADVYSPLDGLLLEVNEALVTSPDTLNKDPYGAGWIAKLKITGTPPRLMSPEEYADYIRKREGSG